MNNKTTPPEAIEDDGILTEGLYRSLLIELSNSVYWKVILKQSRNQDSMALGTLASTDPFKEPTLMARTQGIRQGLYSLENEVNGILEEIKKEEENENEDK